MKIKRGLKKGITGVLIGSLYLLPLVQSQGQSPENSPEKNEINYTKAKGRAIVSPEKPFNHKPCAKI